MPLKSFKELPKNLVEWGRYFQSLVIAPDPDTVNQSAIQDRAITYSKIQNVTPDRLLGRDTSPEGQVQELQVSGGLEFTGSGIQRSQLNGDITAAAGSGTTQFRTVAANSVLGRAVNTPGVPTEIAAASDSQFLKRAAGVVLFDAIVDADIPSGIARDAEVASAISAAISALNIASGTYTPTLTNVSNLDSSSASACQYLRVGSVVTVSGSVDVDATAAADTRLGISLPIPSDFASGFHCAGVAALHSAQQSGAIFADTANDRAELRYLAAGTANVAMFFTFTYLII